MPGDSSPGEDLVGVEATVESVWEHRLTWLEREPFVVEKDGGYAGLSDVVVDLRADDHERPVEELRRLYGLH